MSPAEPSGSRQSGHSRYLSFTRMKVSKIPSIKDLRQELDYGHARERRDILFYNVTRSYPFSFKSSQGIPGSELIRWKYRPHQDGLMEMASQFLDQDGKGQYYWPDDPEAPNHGKLQYSKEPRRIRRVLIQLFFKINQQHKWKGSHQPMVDLHPTAGHQAKADHQPSGPSSSTYQTRDYTDWSRINQQGSDTTAVPQLQDHADANHRSRGHSVEDAIDLETSEWYHDDFAYIKPDKSAWDDASTSTPEPHQYTVQTLQPISTEDTETHIQAPMPTMDAVNDPFDGPHSPEPQVPLAIQRGNKSEKRPVPHGGEEAASQAKRTRLSHDVPERADSHRPDGTAADASSDIASSPATSSRRRNPPHNKGIVTGLAYEEAIDSELSPASIRSASAVASDILLGATADAAPILPSKRSAEQPSRQTSKQPSQTISQQPSQSTVDIEPQASTPRDESHPPLPTLSGSGSTSRPASNSPAVHEHEEESSKGARQILPRVNVRYRVNVSQSVSKGWVPNGTFQGKSLKEVVNELHLEGSFRGLLFALQTPGRRFEDEVMLGEEELFEGVKHHFREKILQVRRSHVGFTKVLWFEISISPITDDQNEAGGQNDEADDDDLFVL